MSALLAHGVTALGLSAIAILALRLAPAASPRLRFVIAACGLAAWLVPWPLVELRLDLEPWSVIDLAGLLGSTRLGAAGADWLAGAATWPQPAPAAWAACVALLVPGVVWLVRDACGYRRQLVSWRRRSVSGEHLRRSAPPALRALRVEIRLVPGSSLAAASGFFGPTVWIGDALGTPADQRLALLHELWHVKRHDPLWTCLLAVVERLYWWNPLVAYLAREVVLAIETGCDQACARSLGNRRYVERLARLLLAAAPTSRAAPVASLRPRNLDVRRLEFLTAGRRLGGRDVVVLAALAALAATFALDRSLASTRPAWQRVAVPDTSAGRALRSMLELLNAGDTDSVSTFFGAYTPQEVDLGSALRSRPLELVAIVSSEPTRIEFLARSGSTDALRLGEIVVAPAAPTDIRRFELRDRGRL